MIDERKMQREIEELIKTEPEGTIEHSIYQILLAYISRQQVISPARIRFEQRMGAVLMAMGKMNVVELTDCQEVLL